MLGVSEGLASARVHADILGQQGETKRGKRETTRAPSILTQSHALQKPCVESSPSHGRNRRENERRGRRGKS